MTDSEKLRRLAAWIDDKYPFDDNRAVQKDLLRIADKIEVCGLDGCWMSIRGVDGED
jgi:hypothetical protein